jgi:light-regulated signal transduction histidine kinase (bacteriophytochrome)
VKKKPASLPTPDFRALFDALPGLYLVLTPDLTIVAVSEAYLRATRTQRAAMLGRPLFDLFPEHPDDPTATSAPNLRASLDRVRQSGVPDTMAVQKSEVPRSNSEGGRFDERHWQPTNSPVFDAAGALVYIIHRVEDVTELERLTSELETSNQQLDSFSYSVSHDLRAPLRAIDGFSQALVEDYGPTLPVEGQRLLATVRERTQWMGRLIDDLIAFFRLGTKPLVMAAVDLAALTRTVVQELQQANADRRVAVTVAALPSVRGDPALLRHVLTNLVGNAFKFTRHRPDAQVEIGTRNEGGNVVCYVRDNGVGFDMRYAGKLFGVFQRLHHADEFEGTGIGLALVQRVMRRHGGRVWAEARVNEGATFFFVLPPGSQE